MFRSFAHKAKCYGFPSAVGLLVLPLLLGLSCASAVHAEEEIDLLDFYEDDETVSISTGTNKPLRLAPSVATVITQEEIERMGARTLDQVLESVAGLHVGRSGSATLNAIYSVRGVHTSSNAQVLMLVDGSPLRQLFTGGRVSRLEMPVGNIKRVEVIRGPGSAVFGADAFSGVINIITKGAKELDGVSLGARSGAFDTNDVWLQYGTELGSGWQLSTSLEYSESDGDDSRTISADLQSALDGAFGTTASLAPGALDTRYQVFNSRIGLRNEHWDLSLYYWDLSDGGVGAGAAQALDPQGRVDAEILQLQGAYKGSFTDKWRFEAKLNYSLLEEKSQLTVLPAGARAIIGTDGNPFTFPPAGFVDFPDGIIGNPGGEEERISGEFINYFSGLSRHSLRVSAGFEIQDGTASEEKNFGPEVIDGTEGIVDGTLTDVSGSPNVYVGDLEREIFYLSLQDEWAFADDWELVAGIRYDNYSDFGSTINPRAALVWATSFNLTTKLLYGRAFRTPSAFELLGMNNPTFLGYENLDPETMDTLELAFNYTLSPSSTVKLNLFAYKIDDLIAFVSDPEAGQNAFTAQNANDQDGYGFEVEYTVKLADGLHIDANYSYQRSEDGSSKEDIHDAPQQQFYLNGAWQVSSHVNISAQLNWVGERSRAVNDNRPDIDDYLTLDARLSYAEILPGLDLSVIGRNIGNADAREPSDALAIGTILEDFPLEERSLFLELKYAF